jgi:hypothetical protein
MVRSPSMIRLSSAATITSGSQWLPAYTCVRGPAPVTNRKPGSQTLTHREPDTEQGG